MKFVIVKSKLEEALSIVSKAISGKNPRVILTGVKIELNDNGLFLTASDGNVSIVSKILPVENNKTNITVFENGVAVIGIRSFSDIVRKFDGNELEIEMIENNVLKIKDDTSDFSLNCMEASDYPLIDLEISGSKFNLSSKLLVKAINQTAYAVSDKETRPVLQGVNLSANGNDITFVATDSFRIAKKIIKLDSYMQFSCTIAGKTLLDIAKIAESDEHCEITISDKKALFKFSNTLVATTVFNQAFPDTSRLIPSSHKSMLTINSNKLYTSIDRTTSLSQDKGIVVRLSMSNNEVKVLSRTQETGSGHDTIREFSFEGETLDVSFTSKYLLDAIKVLDCEEVSICFNGDSSPVILTNKADDSVLSLILPVRTY